jgi:hypothetical protein
LPAIGAADRFNNAVMMQAQPTTDNADLVRGLLIALGLIALSAGAFLLVAHSGHNRKPDIIDRVMTMMAPPPPKAEKKKPPPAAGAEWSANPAAMGGAAGGAGAGDGGPSGAAGGGGSASAAAGLRPVAHNAAQALHQVLQDYRNDPNKTSTVTISSTGRISQATPGQLTAHDGLPMSALNGSILLTTGAPVR